MPATSRWQGFAAGAVACVGLGFLAGALEVVGLAATLRLPVGLPGFVGPGLAAVALMGLVGGVFGLLVAPAAAVTVREPESHAVAAQMGMAGALLCGFYLWEGALVLVGREQVPAAAMMAVMPFAFGGVIFYNARYWLRRAELGHKAPIGWLPVAGGVAALMTLGAALVYGARYTGGAGALDTDPSVILVTVDGLRRDDVGAYGGSPTPRLDELAARGVIYLDVVSPMPASVPANTTVLTGLHPLRHGVLVDGDVLDPGVLTVAEILAGEGYATGGFASSGALSAAGLDRGCLTWDDGTGALARVALVRRLRPAGGGRAPSHTTDAFLAWYAEHGLLPSFAWVHYDASAGAAAIDVEVGRILDAASPDAMVVVAGTYGEMRGEHGLHGTVGLYDELVRVPLLIVAPERDVVETRIELQVRLMDVAETVLAYPKIDHPAETEGVSLLDYALRVRRVGMWSALVGRGGDDLFGTALLGMRNNGLKYVREVRTGRETLYDLADDPTEQVDLSDGQEETVEKARGMVVGDEAALRRRLLAD